KTATITATASSEYVFQSWSGATGSTNSTSVVMNSDKSVTANFVKKKYALTTTVEGEGTVTEKVIKAGAATDYNSGTIVELTAVPSGEWLFVEWKGDVTGTENPTQITIDKAKSVTAVFVKKQYPLTIEIEGEGTVTEEVIKQGLATDYNSGTIVELTAVPSDEWEFKEWTGDTDAGAENPTQITIDKAISVTAVFVKKKSLTINSNTGGGSVYNEANDINLAGVTYYKKGTELSLIAKARNPYYKFVGWGGTFLENINPRTIVMDKDFSILFEFEIFPENGYDFSSGALFSNITSTSASLFTQGLYEHQRKDVIEKGFWVSKNEMPTKLNSQVIIDSTSALNVVQAELDVLDINTTYYVKVYAVNQFGTFTSTANSFTTSKE
ncbi:hypothetical protein N9L37_00640, partial [Flavobacteriaceae bacterium]|nr:hypothetical protein [Flavobacteriaceae bacterium]